MNLLRSQIAFVSHPPWERRAPLLLSAARELESLDPKLARATDLDALTATLFAGRLASGGSALEVSKAALGGPRSPQPPHAWDLLLDGMALLTTDGPSIGVPVLKRAVSAFRAEEIDAEESAPWLWLAGRVAAFIWGYEGWDALTRRQIHVAREVGAHAMLPLALNTRAGVHIFAGELAAAASLYAESDALWEATGREVSYGALPAADALEVHGHDA